MGMFLRRGLGEERTITLSGRFSETRGYVTVRGVKYVEAATLKLRDGTVVEITVDGASDAAKGSCYIKVDGTTVFQGAGTYLYIVVSTAEIKMLSKSIDNVNYRSCEITTS